MSQLIDTRINQPVLAIGLSSDTRNLITWTTPGRVLCSFGHYSMGRITSLFEFHSIDKNRMEISSPVVDQMKQKVTSFYVDYSINFNT